MNIAAFTQHTSDFPGYVSINTREDGKVVVTVRTPGQEGKQLAEVDMSPVDFYRFATEAVAKVHGVDTVNPDAFPHAEQWGGLHLLYLARAVVAAAEALPASSHATEVSSRVSDAAHGLQQLQMAGDHFWPRHVVTLPGADVDDALTLLAGVRAWREAERQAAFPDSLRQAINRLLAKYE